MKSMHKILYKVQQNVLPLCVSQDLYFGFKLKINGPCSTTKLLRQNLFGALKQKNKFNGWCTRQWSKSKINPCNTKSSARW